MKAASLTIGLIAAALSGSALAGPTAMEPGLWEITTETEIPGMPMKMPAQTIRHCYTAEELAQDKGQGGLPPSQGHCQVSDMHTSGNTTTWTVNCTGDRPMHGTGHMTHEADHYQGGMESVMQNPGGEMHMNMRWTGKRIGNCP